MRSVLVLALVRAISLSAQAPQVEVAATVAFTEGATVDLAGTRP